MELDTLGRVLMLSHDFDSASRVSPSLLLNLIPFNSLSEEERIVIANSALLENGKKGGVLTRVGELDDWDYYLIEGTVRLEAEDGKVFFLEGGTIRANAPIAHLQPRKYTVKALTPIIYLQVSYELTKNLIIDNKQESVELKDNLKVNPLYLEISDEIANDTLIVPSMPEIARNIRDLVEDQSSSINKVAKAIQVDPAISAKLIKTANGALYHGQKNVDTCLRAITRLGMTTTKDLVTSFVMRNLFNKNIKTPELRTYVKGLWAHSIDVAAISRVLAKVTPSLDTEEALLIGLLHDIGKLVIVSYAEKYPRIARDKRLLRNVINELKGEIGYAVLNRWKFPQHFLQVPLQADNWKREHDGPVDYTDLVIVAQVHSFVSSGKLSDLPYISEIPAFTKVAEGKLDPDLSLRVVDKAKELIQETRQLFVMA